MHWIEGCGVGPHRNGFLRGTNRVIVIKWEDMCNDRLQSLFSFLLADSILLLSGLAIVILTISKQAAFASIAIVALPMAKSHFFFFMLSFVFSVAFIGI